MLDTLPQELLDLIAVELCDLPLLCAPAARLKYRWLDLLGCVCGQLYFFLKRRKLAVLTLLYNRVWEKHPASVFLEYRDAAGGVTRYKRHQLGWAAIADTTHGTTTMTFGGVLVRLVIINHDRGRVAVRGVVSGTVTGRLAEDLIGLVNWAVRPGWAIDESMVELIGRVEDPVYVSAGIECVKKLNS